MPKLLILATMASMTAQDIGSIPADVLSKQQRSEARGMIDRWNGEHLKEANRRNREAWLKVKTRQDWEKFRDHRIDLLRRSLGEYPPPGKPRTLITATLAGDGYRIDNVVYESRPGNWVAGNLYRPLQPRASMPGLILAHAHHRDKPQSELQDMGMTWARAGCVVLVIDQVGHGERRSHPFHAAADYAKSFKVPQQDYYFRYDTGIQLQLLGDSLMGWMAWDLMRGVDVLLAQQGIDPRRIIILGAVAGGGDPAAVSAALDPRIACCVPFNFGGPQPETAFPLPEDSETSYNYAGWTYWDSTRGLRLGVRDEFFPWVIVASIAPRSLIHAHEFSWDREHDPVWKRYQKIWGEFYGAGDRLGAAHGKGLLRQQPPAASHCTNIGKFHRRMIHPLFDRWFGIKVAEQDEFSSPCPRDQLICWTEKARRELRPLSLNETISRLGSERIERARARLPVADAQARRRILAEDWRKLLGPIDPQKPAVVKSRSTDEQPIDGAMIERIVLEVETGIVVPLLMLLPAKRSGPAPVVVGLAQAGKRGFLKERAAELKKLIDAGVAVVLPDLRGSGETRTDDGRGKRSADTNASVHVQLFGETLLGQRLRDVRSVLAYLRTRPDVDGKRLALWGESFAPVNGPATDFKVPREADVWPAQSEPLGGLLTLLTALFDSDIRAMHIRGGLLGYHAVLTHFAVLIPHDAAVPGALTAGDLCDLAGCLAPRPLRFENMVDHLNRPVAADDVRKAYAPAVRGYAAEAPRSLDFADGPSTAAAWLVEQINARRTP